MRLALQRAGRAGCAAESGLADSLRRLFEALRARMPPRRTARFRAETGHPAATACRPMSNDASIPGRRCQRADLDHRDRVVALALRKERLVGAPARGLGRTGGRPLKRGRRFDCTGFGPDGLQSRMSPST